MELLKVKKEDLIHYKRDMQQAFQKGFENVCGKKEEIVLPEGDIDRSLNTNGAIAYKAVVEGDMI